MKLNQEELELTLLSHMMSSPDAIQATLDKRVGEEHFIFRSAGEKSDYHGRLFRLMTSYYNDHQCITTPFVIESKLVEYKVKDKTRGIYLTILARIQELDEPDPNDLPEILEQMRSRYVMALFQQMLNNVRDKLIDEDGTLDDCLELIQDDLNTIHDVRTDEKTLRQQINFHESADWFEEEYRKRLNEPEKFSGIPCGLKEIDEKTFGWMPGHLIVGVAPTGGGKSIWMLNCAITANEVAKKRVLYMSYEMELYQCYMRHISCLYRIPYMDIKSLNLQEDDLKMLLGKLRGGNDMPYFEYDVNLGDPTPEYVASKVRELEKTYGAPPELIVVDYVGNMTYRGAPKTAKSWELHEEAGVRLFQLAKNTGIPIITAQQINREAVKDNRRAKEQGKYMTFDQACASGGQRLMHAAQYVIAIEPDTVNQISTIHGVKMRDAPFESFGVKVDPAHYGIYPLDAEDQEEWKRKRGIIQDSVTVTSRPSTTPTLSPQKPYDPGPDEDFLDLSGAEF